MRKLKVSLIVLYAIASMVAISSSILNVKDAYANQATQGFHKYSQKRLNLYHAAAYSFWNQRGDLTKYGKRVDCMPADIKIVYYNDSASNVLAHVKGLHGQVIEDVMEDEWKFYPKSEQDEVRDGYCKIYVNKDNPTGTLEGCVTFIHEYGHLLGKNHVENNQSPMYQGFLSFEQSMRFNRYIRWQSIIIGKSVCKASDFINNTLPPLNFN